MLTLKMKKVRPGAIIPKRATSGSAGLDLCACTENEVVLKAGERTVIPTGIAIAIENNETAAFVYARSGLGIKHGISLSNGVGVIDGDYRGEICVGLINTSSEDYTIQPGERIAQLVFAPVIPAQPVEVDSLDETERGEEDSAQPADEFFFLLRKNFITHQTITAGMQQTMTSTILSIGI